MFSYLLHSFAICYISGLHEHMYHYLHRLRVLVTPICGLCFAVVLNTQLLVKTFYIVL